MPNPRVARCDATLSSERRSLGEALVSGERLPALTALRRAGIEPLTLQMKEGLALLNGTHLMAGLGVLLVDEARRPA